MKHVYPPRHPASLDTPAAAPAGGLRDTTAEPAVAHEPGESSRADPGHGDVTDPVRGDGATPRRGPGAAPR